jgi:hypothetical protein
VTTGELKKLDPLDRLCYFVVEREKVRVAKESGARPPWTHDPILKTYRFCNVRRADDKVSRWLIDNWYTPYRGHPNLPLACLLARQLNNPESLDAVGFPDVWDPKKVAGILDDRKSGGAKNFSAAYMITGTLGGTKVEQIVYKVVDVFYRSGYKGKTRGWEGLDATSMENTWKWLVGRPGMQSFMAGQVVADMRHAVVGSWEDRNDWAPIGPGSRRGMNRLHGRDKKFPLGQDDFLRELRELIPYVREALPGGKGEQLEAMDVQSVLCETDKYSRVLLGEGRPKQLYRGG